MPTCIKRRAPKRRFARGSFRWTPKRRRKRGSIRHLIACPKGKWDADRESCRVGTKIYETVIVTKGRCPRGYRKKR